MLDTVVAVTWKDYVCTWNRRELVTLVLPTPRPTILQMLNTLQKDGKFHYRFATEHEGCRSWVRSVVHTLETHGLVAAPSYQTVVARSGLFFGDRDGPVPKEVKNGSFNF